MSVGWKKMRDLTFFGPLKNWVYTTDTQTFLILLKINTVIHACQRGTVGVHVMVSRVIVTCDDGGA